MKKLLILQTVWITMFSCNPVTGSQQENVLDSGVAAIDPIVKQHMVDSMVNGVMKDAYLKDTAGTENAPIKIISARPATKEYSSYKDITLTYKNVSAKTISAIKFKWYGLNAFGEPADMGAVTDGIGAGFTDKLLKAGKLTSSTFDISSRDLKKVVKAWPYEVAFEDGTKWKSTK